MVVKFEKNNWNCLFKLKNHQKENKSELIHLVSIKIIATIAFL